MTRWNIIARGTELQFEKNAMVDIRFSTRAEAPPVEKSPAKELRNRWAISNLPTARKSAIA